MPSIKKIVFLTLLFGLIVIPLHVVFNNGSLSVETSKALATVYCQTGGVVDSFPGDTCPSLAYKPATSQQIADYQANPANAPAIAKAQQQDKNLQPISGCSGITGCLAWTVYWIGPGFASWVMSISAEFFNFIVGMSLNSTAYALGFLTSGWTLVLGIANMFFIFILIYAAFIIMLKAETARTMQILAWVIAIALIVNFSFFFTRVVIDAGNIVATQFYNKITTQVGGATLQGTGTSNAPVDITTNIMKSLGAEKPLTPEGFANAQKVIGPGNAPWSTLLVLTVVYLSTAVLFWMLAAGLIMIAVKFLVRIVGLWFILIASPLAFVSKTLNKTQHFFDMWLRTLVGFAFYPAIFLFMFYVLNMFVADLAGSKLFNALASKQNLAAGATVDPLPLLGQLADVFIRMGFLIVMMYIMLRAADWIMEQSGGLATSIMNRASSALVSGGFRTAAQTVGLAGRLGVGGVGGSLMAGGARLAARSGNKDIASGLWSGADFFKRRSFDVRNVPGVKGGFGLAGVNVGTGQKGGFRSYEQTVKGWKGRWDKESDERKKEIQEKIDGIEARQAARRQSELDAYDPQGLDKDIKRRDELHAKATTGAISLSERAEWNKLRAANLDAKKTSMEKSENKTLDELKTEHAIVTKKVEGFKTSQVINLKSANLEKITKYLSDAGIKAIKESNKYSYAQKDGIEKRWHETSKNAPAAKVIKEIEKLSEVHKDLVKLDRHLAAKLSTLDSHVTQHEAGNLVTVDLAKAEKMKKEVDTELDTLKAVASGLSGNDRKDANLRVNLLQKEAKRLEDVVEKIKDVPAGTGGNAAPAAVNMQKK